MELGSEIFSNPEIMILAIVASVVLWVTLAHRRDSEAKSDRHYKQFDQYQEELPKLAEAIELLTSRIDEQDKEHHGIIMDRGVKINELESTVRELQKEMSLTKARLNEADKRLIKCETWREIATQTLKTDAPDLYKKLVKNLGDTQ